MVLGDGSRSQLRFQHRGFIVTTSFANGSGWSQLRAAASRKLIMDDASRALLQSDPVLTCRSIRQRLNSLSQLGMVKSGSPRQDIESNQGGGKPR